jgi:SulP family sulfate permease
VALVALAQGAGIRPAFPNPDGSRSSSSRDFLGQGLGNVAGAFFQSTPTGGSLSRTAVSADGGATGRVAGYIAAATVVVLVVVFGTFVGAIPEAVIGGLLFVIGVELVMGRMPDARLAWRTGMTSRVLFAITLTLTLTVPLQYAIIGGAVLSLLAFVVSSASRVDLHRATRDDVGWRLSNDVPATLPAGEPIVLRYDGPNFFADVSGFAERLPEPDALRPGVLVMDLGALEHFSSTTLKSLEKMHAKFAAGHSGLVLTGVEANARDVLVRTGLLALLGEQNVLPTDPHIGGSLDAGLLRGQALLSELQGMPS